MKIDARSVLITGGGGQLASDLEEQLRDRCLVSAPSRGELDITDQGALDEAFERVRPAVVFNCAAFHNVEVCEREEDRSFEVNARAVKRLAQRCADAGAGLVHLSTNYVFAGDRRRALLRGRPAEPTQHLRDLQAGRGACRARLLPRRAGRSRLRSLWSPRKRVEGRQLRAAHDRPRARAGCAEDGRGPAPDAHVHGGPGRGHHRRGGAGRLRAASRHQLRRPARGTSSLSRSWRSPA